MMHTGGAMQQVISANNAPSIIGALPMDSASLMERYNQREAQEAANREAQRQQQLANQAAIRARLIAELN